ncbi:MAG: YihY/virulence factor BrkB family protein, partial [Bacteroidales bacterium]|nr:YihY/virulence factor BrkB family protein [Bacteroidales bacterium]
MVSGKKLVSQTRKFIREDIWKTSPEQHSRGRYFLIRQVKIFFIAFREFFDKKIQMRASALTYYTLLSVVPVVAMVFGIAKGFGLEQRLETEITSHLKGQEEVVSWIINFARNLLQNANGGIIAGVGMVILFWSVMSVLSNIERSFNDIWQIRQARPFVRKFTDYLSIMLLAPVIIILSSSVTVFLSVQVQSLTETSIVLQKLSSLIQFLFELTPYILVWFLFTLVYIVMPNTRVRFTSALIAGVLAGTVFQIVQWGYIHFQIGVNRYSAIYGGFAALPLFLVWLQLSWLIILFGAEISFANQNVEKYEF